MTYRLNLLMIFLFALPIISKATVHEKIITDCNDISDVCIGDTIRFIGDSINSNAYGVTYVTIFNSISQNTSYYIITSDSGIATSQDHVIINGDESFQLEMCGNTILYLIYNCPLNIDNLSENHYQTQITPNPTTGTFIIGNQKQNIELFAASGKKLLEVYDNKVNITNFNTGIYFLITKNNLGEILSRDKIIKK